MKRYAVFFSVVLGLFLLPSCGVKDESYLRAVNTSSNSNYEDIITDIYVCEGATNDNYVSVWNGRLSPGESKKISVNPGRYGIKFVGKRQYTSGIVNAISETTGYKTPIRFDTFYTVRVTFDGNGITANDED